MNLPKPAKAGLLFCLLLFICLYFPLSVQAKENTWTHSVYFENDMFTGSDNDYTNGVKYALISPDLSPDADIKLRFEISRTLLDYFHKLPLVRNVPQATGHKLELAIGQNMYTPKDIASYDLIEDDRPYAGYLYLSSAYHRKSDQDKSWSTMDTAEIQLGMVGPASLAEEAQTFVHRVRDLQIPNGWDNQLHNEPALTLAFERKWLYHPPQEGLGADLILHTGMTLGNVMTYANGGAEIRAGWNVPRSFSTSHIRPAGSTWLTPAERISCYGFLTLNGKAVARDIFLDGNTFRDSHSVDKKYFVGEMSTGVTTSYRNLSLSLTYTHSTREFEEQDDTHGFASITLNYAFASF